MCIGRLVYHRKKDSGTTYVYEVVEEHWDKQLKQMRSKQACIGKLDPDTKELIPSKRTKSVSSCTVTASTTVVGPMLILDKIRKIPPRLLLGEMESLTRIHYTGKYNDVTSEVSKSQREILEAFSIDPNTL